MTSAPSTERTAAGEGVSYLLALAPNDPPLTLRLVKETLAGDPDSTTAAVAHQAAGIALRDSGDITAALKELRTALGLVREAGTRDRLADVLATYGGTLVVSGRTAQGFRHLDEATRLARGGLLGRVRHRRAFVLYLIGRHEEALENLQLALKAVKANGDVLWEAHIRNAQCMAHLALGRADLADRDAVAAGRIYADLGHGFSEAMSVQNRGVAALRRGDLPRALRLLDDAASRFQRLGEVPPHFIVDRSEAFLIAGLAIEAVEVAEDFLVSRVQMQPIQRAELLHIAAAAALAAGDSAAALKRAQVAQRMFAVQERPYWEARARFVALQARHTGGRRDQKLQSEATELARRLTQLRSEDAVAAYLFAGRLALQRGDRETANACLEQVAPHRRRGPALSRTTGWLAVALQAESRGEPKKLLAACRAGLDALDEHRLTFGGTELRALATGYGRELAALALRQALRSGQPRDLLIWSERWRATALTAPAVRPPDDAELARDLAALRDAARRADAARSAGQNNNPAERERNRWEAAVRQRRLKVSGRGGTASRLDVGAVLDALGDTRAVVLVEVDSELHALTISRRRVRRYRVGRMDDALKEAEFARFSLRGAAYGRRIGDLAGMGARLEAALLGPATGDLAGGPLVVVPPARLHGVPWALLPSLGASCFTVSPSLSMWLKAVAHPAPAEKRVALVLGPGLTGAEAEIARLQRLHRRATVLENGAASVEQTLDHLDGAWLAHVAAHGSFRSDSPLFSNLTLDDGPMTVHDIDRLRRPPYRMILSACDVGSGEAVGADEQLGLVTSLLGLGTTGVLASVVPVHDAAAVPIMECVHSMLAAGQNLAEAWLAARTEATGDGLTAATAASFTAWGN